MRWPQYILMTICSVHGSLDATSIFNKVWLISPKIVCKSHFSLLKCDSPETFMNQKHEVMNSTITAGNPLHLSFWRDSVNNPDGTLWVGVCACERGWTQLRVAGVQPSNLPFPLVLSSQLPQWSCLPFNYQLHDKESERVMRDTSLCLINFELILSLNANQGKVWFRGRRGWGRGLRLYMCVR